jgi:hypothetical protein
MNYKKNINNMKKIILLLTISSTILFGCGNVCNEIPSKINYIKVGFPNRADVYLRIEGTGKFDIRYNNLIQMKSDNCQTYDTIALDISHYSVISEEEYNKYIGLTHLESITTDTIVIY